MGVETIDTTQFLNTAPPCPSLAHALLHVSTTAAHFASSTKQSLVFQGLSRQLFGMRATEQQSSTPKCAALVSTDPASHWAGSHPVATCVQEDVLLLQRATGAPTGKRPGVPTHGLHAAPATPGSDAGGDAAVAAAADSADVLAGKLAAAGQQLQACRAALLGVQQQLASTQDEAALLTVRIFRSMLEHVSLA